MATVGSDVEEIADAQIPQPRFVLKLQASTAPEHQNPFLLLLVIPVALRTAGVAGVNAFQTPLRPLRQDVDLFGPIARAGVAEQVGLVVVRGWLRG